METIFVCATVLAIVVPWVIPSKWIHWGDEDEKNGHLRRDTRGE